MSIRRLGTDKWQLDYYPHGGKGKRERLTFYGTESGARGYEMELRRQHSGYMTRGVNPRIMDILPEYLEWHKLHRAPRTHEDVKKSLKWLLPVFDKLQVPRITHATINQYKLSRAGKNRAITKELHYLSAIINWMCRNNYANPLPFKIERMPYKRTLPMIPHPSEIQKFMDAIRRPLQKALVLLMYQAGMRFTEAAHIKWENIDMESGTILLETTKGDEPRLAVLPDEVKAIMEPLSKPQGYVFENPLTGKPVQSLKTLFKYASARAGIRRINPHLLRHACGTYTLEATGDLRLVQEILGHKDISTTQIYTQIAMVRKKAGMQRTADYIRQLKTTRNGLTQALAKPED